MATQLEKHFVETYEGIRIYQGEDGFYGSNGCDYFGYHDKLADIREEIEDYWEGSEHGELNGFFEDRF